MDTAPKSLTDLQWHRGNELFSQLDSYLTDLYHAGTTVDRETCANILTLFAGAMQKPITFKESDI